MSDLIREFLVGIGYKVDQGSERAAVSSARRVEEAVTGSDARSTASVGANAARRLLWFNRERGIRTAGAAELIKQGKAAQRSEAERLAADKLAAEARAKLHDKSVQFARGLTSVVQAAGAAAVGTAAALAGVAVTAGTIVERMAAGLERVYYASQRTKSSAANLKAFGFAAAQLGSSVESAMSALETFAERQRASPGYEAMLKSLGVKTRDENGGVIEYTKQMQQLGEVLAKMPSHQQKSFAGQLGIDDALLASLTSGKYQKQMDRYREMITMAGMDPDEAAVKSKKFMDNFREMQEAISIVAIRVQSALVDKFGGAIEKFTAWLLKNSGRIAEAIIAIGEVLGRWSEKLLGLFDAFQKLSPQTQDFLVKLAALAAALLVFNAGPLGAILAITAAIVAFLKPEHLKWLGEMWDKFDALAKKLTGQDGVTVAFAALGAVMALKVLAPLAKVLTLLRAVSGFALSPWLLALLGVGAAVAHDYQKNSTPEGRAKVISEGEDAINREQGGQSIASRMWNRAKAAMGFGGGSGGGSGGGVPIGSSAGNLTALVEAEAKRAGIDPRIMHGIRAGESLKGKDYDVKSDSKEDSYGPFQLNRRGGLGQIFEKETGLNVKDPKTIPDQVRWVANHIKKKLAANPNYNPGSEWYGYKGLQNAQAGWGDSGYAPSQAGGDVEGKDGVGAVNQRQGGGVRRQAVTDLLKAQLATAAREAGVNAEIYSGGQDAHGPNRIGSHRHDHGQSADLKLYQTGPDGKRRYLSMNNDGDRALMERFIKESVKAGANGVGSGPGYMGEHGIHIGGGSPSAWGAGGSAANAPAWVRRAWSEGMAERSRGGIKLDVKPEVAERLGKAVDGLNSTFGRAESSGQLQSPFRTAPLGDGRTINNANKTISIQTGPTHITASGLGDAKEAGDVLGRKQGRVHADLVRNLESAIG